MIDEIILELEKAYPSNSYENIIADHVRTVHWPFAGSVTRLGDFLSDTFPFKSSPNIWCFFGYVDTHHFKVNTALATIG